MFTEGPEGDPAGCHSRQGSEPPRGGDENSVQIDCINLDQDFREFDARRFVVSIFKTSTIGKKISWCNTIPNVQGRWVLA